MKYYARIVSILDGEHSFTNISDQKRELFRVGSAICIAYSDASFLRQRLIFEYGPFSNREDADNGGKDLARQIKIYLAEHDVPISMTSSVGSAEADEIVANHDGVEERNAQEINTSGGMLNRPVNVNGYIGLAVYSAETSMDDLTILDGEVSVSLRKSFNLKNSPMIYWNEKMDRSLSLLTSSVALNDIRVVLLLRIMSIEVLVSDFESCDEEELNKINAAIAVLENVDLDGKMKKLLKGVLEGKKGKSIGRKVNELLMRYLGCQEYGGVSASEFFKKCYSARSAFTHSGKREKITPEMTHELKNLCLDLLAALSAG